MNDFGPTIPIEIISFDHVEYKRCVESISSLRDFTTESDDPFNIEITDSDTQAAESYVTMYFISRYDSFFRDDPNFQSNSADQPSSASAAWADRFICSLRGEASWPGFVLDFMAHAGIESPGHDPDQLAINIGLKGKLSYEDRFQEIFDLLDELGVPAVEIQNFIETMSNQGRIYSWRSVEERIDLL